MKRIVFSASLALFLSCSATDGNAENPPVLPVLWEVSDGLQAPESAYFDKGSGFLFVSQVGGGGATGKDGDGCIAKLAPDGKVIDNKWIAGLNSPKGLRSHDGTLWVSDIDRIVGIDIEKGEIAATVEVAGAKFLNDVACDAAGAVYVSDMSASKIYCFKEDEVSVFAEGDELEYPNGLLVEGARMIVAAWGSGGAAGRLFSLDLKTKTKTLITPEPVGNLDGLEGDGKGGYIVTDWVSGKVFQIGKDGTSQVILQLPQGTADHAYLSDKSLLILPQMSENKVTAFDLSRSSQ